MTEYLEFAAQTAREAGAILRLGFGRAEQIEYKGAVDLVTEFDRRSEAHILERIHTVYPEHQVRAEETGRSGRASEHEWLVDPLDGTVNFAHGFPIFAVSLALTRRGELQMGVVYDPMRDELFAAELGRGATLNGAPIRVSAERDLSKALLTTGFPYDVRTNPQNNFAEFINFYMRSQAVRRPGSAALDCCYVACGRCDGYWEYKMKPWDVGAGGLIVREAGGRVTTASGDEDFLGADSIVASNGHLHEQMLRVLREGEAAPLPSE